MKRMIALAMVAAAAAALWAGCGGGNTNNKPADNHGHDHEHGHGHGDEHTGKHHNLGKITLGDMTAEVTQIGEPKLGEESIFEVKLLKAGKAVEGVTVEGWLADEAGKELGAAGKGEWNAKESMYDVHTHTPKELPAKVMLWVRVIANDGTETKGSVAIDKD